MSLFWDDDEGADDVAYEVTPEGVAIIPVCGTLVDSEPAWWMSYLGYASTPEIAEMVTAASADLTVSAILLLIDSPGGQVSGLYAACQAVWQVRQSGDKKIWAACKEVCSATYELASQCDRIYLTEDGMAGCIGTIISLADWSGYYSQMGVVKKRITSTGAETYKGEGTPGTKITPEQEADFKRICDEYRAIFNRVIVRGRNLSLDTLQTLADGRVHVGRNALSLGIVDGIASQADVLAALGSGAEIEGWTEPPPDPDTDTEPDDRRQQSHMRPPPTQRQPKPKITGSAHAGPVALSLKPEPTGSRKDFAMSDTNNGAFKDRLVRALTAFGLGAMAVKVLGSNSQDADGLAATMAENVGAEVQTKLDAHPLIVACRTAGIATPEDLSQVLEAKELGDEYLAKLRGEAKAESTRLYGAEAGPVIAAGVDQMSASAVKVQLASWRTEADARFRTKPGVGATRQTLPVQGTSAAVDTEQPEKPASLNSSEIYASRQKTTR